MLKKEVIKKSKHLSKILRHDPSRVNISLDDSGWTSVEILLRNINMTMEELDFVVENNNKKRYEFNDDKTRIRASQGHSVEVDLGYEESIPPEILYHGTSDGGFERILIDGIKKMGRHHVHLSDSSRTAFIVGSRHGPPMVLEVSAMRMHDDGIEFYLSTNGVWLVDYVDCKYILDI